MLKRYACYAQKTQATARVELGPNAEMFSWNRIQLPEALSYNQSSCYSLTVALQEPVARSLQLDPWRSRVKAGAILPLAYSRCHSPFEAVQTSVFP